jgi:uncharacterized damage-inducible protein DinB
MRHMAEDTSTLTTFYTSWQAYQDHLTETLTSLTADQLALRTAPGLHSLGETVVHIIGCRRVWFTGFLGEDGGAEVKASARWDEPEAPVPSAGELAAVLDRTWHLMADCLARWSPADMHQTFADERQGKRVELTRAQVVWHVLEHDLHHGGEVSLTLGMHGIPAEFPTVWFPD